MPSIFVLSGPNLSGLSAAPQNHTFPSRILSTTPLQDALGVTGLSQAAANFWLGIGLGVAGMAAFHHWALPALRHPKKSSSGVSGPHYKKPRRRSRR